MNDEGYEGSNDEETALASREPAPGQMIRQDFTGAALVTENAATAALVAKARADIEARWVMAMRRPRNMDNVRQLVLNECRRPGFAQAAIYKRPMGSNTIEGLSIRFAEVAMRCMGNMPCETQTIFDSETERITRVTVTDLEQNVTWSKDLTIKKTVERKQLKRGQRPLGERVNSYGDRVYIVEATDDEVNVKESAMVSKAARTLILRCIPGNIQDEAKALCKQIAADKTAKDPAAARNQVFDAFATIAVLPAELAKYLGHPLEQASPAEIDELRNLYVAIRDGETTWPEAMHDALESGTGRPNGKTATPPPPPPAPPMPAKTSNTEIAEHTKPPENTKPPRATGRGSAALKDQLKPPANPPTPAPTPTPSSSESTSSAGDGKTSSTNAATSPVAHSSQPSPTTERPVVDDLEERSCAKCGLPIEVRKGDPEGAQCYACANS